MATRELVCERVRLGHALDRARVPDGEIVLEALRIARGETRLEPRAANDNEAVGRAEALLGAEPRPVYAYVGDLHPGLGQVGLLFACRWFARCAQGICRCDTGGLAGRRGGFAALRDEEVAEALAGVTLLAAQLPEWHAHFVQEVTGSYSGGLGDYVGGTCPDAQGWTDARRRCIEHASTDENKALMDRRLWTWEARMQASPETTELEYLVLSAESGKELDALHRDGEVVPPELRILRGRVTNDGVHHFHQPVVRRALRGEEL